jgi:hypothetical protein
MGKKIDPSSTRHSIATTFDVDGTLQARQMTEEVSTRGCRGKPFKLHERHDAHKKIMADLSQICDGRSLEIVRQESCSSHVAVDETKTLPRAKNQGEEWQLAFGDRHSSDGHEYEEAIRDPENQLSSLAMTCPSLYSKPALDLAASCPNLSAQTTSESNMMVRKKHCPLHRCPSTNGLVTSIIKPSRYTRVSMNASPSSATNLYQSRGTIGRTISISSMHSNNPQLNSSTYSDLAGTDPWIPPGVDFDPNIEVCLFLEYEESLFF